MSERVLYRCSCCGMKTWANGSPRWGGLSPPGLCAGCARIPERMKSILKKDFDYFEFYDIHGRGGGYLELAIIVRRRSRDA